MTIELNPYLMFDGEARAAVEFYHSVLGGELSLTTFGQGMGDQADADSSERIMHASIIVARGLRIMVSDSMPGMGVAANGTISLSSDGTDAVDGQTLHRYWDGLSAGGTVTLPLEIAPWGDAFGQLVDKFGVSWMVNITAARSQG